MLWNRTDEKRVLTRDVVNPEPRGGKHPSLLNRKVIPKGTVITVSEWDPDPEMVKRVYGQNVADLTPAQMVCLKEGEIAVHPDSNEYETYIKVGKAQRLYALLVEASDPVEQTLEDWALENYNPDGSTITIIRILGKVLQAVLALDTNLPLLMGIDEHIDDLVKGLLSKPKPTTPAQDKDADTKDPSGHRPTES
jgi:hypothetical protein